ncbi:MAG: Ig-like domain-containing protein, partial [Acidobacteria bacterium]|nr:Ig-like domain-containing protein [Acidobacteriota bacterium]
WPAGARSAFAQDAREATAIRIGAPASLEAGQRAVIQAVLVDSAGKPIAKALIAFTSPAAFLNNSGDAVVATAVTNKGGQAVIEYEARSAGRLTLKAEYRGDERYAPAQASAQLNVSNSEQLYVEYVAVRIPGLNTPPFVNPWASTRPGSGVTFYIAALWPAMTGWPIAAVLIVVWSLYVFVAVMFFRVAAGSGAPQDVSPTERMEA